MSNKNHTPAKPEVTAPVVAEVTAPVVAEVTATVVATVEHNVTVEDNSDAAGDASDVVVTESERELGSGVLVVSYV